MQRLFTVLSLVLFSAVSLACGSKSQPESGPVTASSDPATVEVTNNNWLDMSIYATDGGKRLRLGMVTTMATERFEVPTTLVSSGTSLQLIANPVGATGSYETEQVNVWPGQTIEFRIENQIGISNISVK